MFPLLFSVVQWFLNGRKMAPSWELVRKLSQRMNTKLIYIYIKVNVDWSPEARITRRSKQSMVKISSPSFEGSFGSSISTSWFVARQRWTSTWLPTLSRLRFSYTAWLSRQFSHRNILWRINDAISDVINSKWKRGTYHCHELREDWRHPRKPLRFLLVTP